MTDINSIIGEWHINEMEMWDADYFNMEVQAYLKINQKLKGKFQFGLVTGEMNGKINGEKYEFNWEGNDENDEASGSGWITIKDNNAIEGEFRFYEGDNSTFIAIRYK
jgi:hypothetical protein